VHRDGSRGGAVAGGIACSGGQGVGAIARVGGVPGDRVGRSGVFSAQGGAVEQELDADGADVGGGARADRSGAREGVAAGGGGDVHGRRCCAARRSSVLVHRDGSRGGAVAGGVARSGGQGVGAIARVGGVPGDGVGRGGVFSAQGGAVEQEL